MFFFFSPSLSLSLYLSRKGWGAAERRKTLYPFHFSSFVELFLVEEGDEVRKGVGGGLKDSVVVIQLVEYYRDVEV